MRRGRPTLRADGSETSGSEDKAAPDSSAAGHVLAECLWRLHLEGKRPAEAFCTMSYWASKAGAQRNARGYTHRPDAPSGHFMRHFDATNDVKMTGFANSIYKRTLGLAKYDLSRTAFSTLVHLPHECLVEETAQNTGMLGDAHAKAISGHRPRLVSLTSWSPAPVRAP